MYSKEVIQDELNSTLGRAIVLQLVIDCTPNAHDRTKSKRLADMRDLDSTIKLCKELLKGMRG